MKTLSYILIFICCTANAQHILPLDTLKLRETKELFADDYGNIYLYRNKDFSLTKYDSLGIQQGRLMLTVPFRIQSVQNPLNIPSFSENAQVLRFYDQNLNEIQTVDLRAHFGYVKAAFAEDQQFVWILDDSTRRLVRYNFREARVTQNVPLSIAYDKVRDLLVFDSRIYILTDSQLTVYSFKAEKIVDVPIENGKRLRRENDRIYIIAANSLSLFTEGQTVEIFRDPDASIVDKNSTRYFVIKGNNLYLYPVNN